MTTKLAALATVLMMFGCTGTNPDATSAESLTAKETAVAAAASSVVTSPVCNMACTAGHKCCNGGCVIDTALCLPPPPQKCGPVASDPSTAGGASSTAIIACPADQQCCDGFCVPDTALCVAPPPQCKVNSDCPQPGAPCKICPDGSAACYEAVCDAGQCKVNAPVCPSPKTCNPASASPVDQCGLHESCCNGKCQPDGLACKLEPPPGPTTH